MRLTRYATSRCKKVSLAFAHKITTFLFDRFVLGPREDYNLKIAMLETKFYE